MYETKGVALSEISRRACVLVSASGVSGHLCLWLPHSSLHLLLSERSLVADGVYSDNPGQAPFL